MHRQIRGVVIGSPIRQALINIFEGYNISKLFQIISKPKVPNILLLGDIFESSLTKSLLCLIEQTQLALPVSVLYFEKNLICKSIRSGSFSPKHTGILSA